MGTDLCTTEVCSKLCANVILIVFLQEIKDWCCIAVFTDISKNQLMHDCAWPSLGSRMKVSATCSDSCIAEPLSSVG